MQKIITHSRKDRDGDILAIGTPYEAPIQKAEAIRNIENGSYIYYSKNPNRSTVSSRIEVINDRFKGKYLKTIPDGILANNLDNLPDF